MAACTLVFLHSLDTLITFILMTHTYTEQRPEGGLFIQSHLWCRCPLLNFKLHVDTEGLGEGDTVNICVSGQVLDSTHMPNPEVPSEAFPQTAASIHARAICNYLLEIPNLHEDVVSASEWAGVKQLND